MRIDEAIFVVVVLTAAALGALALAVVLAQLFAPVVAVLQEGMKP
jgi:hypothetical protein